MIDEDDIPECLELGTLVTLGKLKLSSTIGSDATYQAFVGHASLDEENANWALDST